ncbi:MAG: tRNA (adenosine(37)-N6)-threonylcarbamoyltransferase complex dimerization subunit type 1 TsaB, partial [Chloroflexi bacterium]|nr:tRNA (adenosine(37)-N6)-threonylcarbamoyltransferase complex dimerization subunit type 1 TsaB [Chloroflexota bacterium]
MLLAIDTATAFASIALMDTRGVPKRIELRGATAWHTERNHTVELLPNIVRLTSECDVRAGDVQAIAVAIGPGSYTGLRIGLSVAKGFCFANAAALVGVPTLDISADAYAPRDDTTLCAVLQAGRGRLAARFYGVERGVWSVQRDEFMGRTDELAAKCADQRTFFVGEVDDATERLLREQLGDLATFAPTDERKRDPRVLARLGWERWQRGDVDDVE